MFSLSISGNLSSYFSKKGYIKSETRIVSIVVPCYMLNQFTNLQYLVLVAAFDNIFSWEISQDGIYYYLDGVLPSPMELHHDT